MKFSNFAELHQLRIRNNCEENISSVQVLDKLHSQVSNKSLTHNAKQSLQRSMNDPSALKALLPAVLLRLPSSSASSTFLA